MMLISLAHVSLNSSHLPSYTVLNFYVLFGLLHGIAQHLHVTFLYLAHFTHLIILFHFILFSASPGFRLPFPIR